MPELTRWVAWRRKKDTDDPWEILPQTEAAGRAACFRLIADEELKAGELHWEYAAEPLGKTPDSRKWGSQQYRHRAMRARGQ
jgi:hypothetical protein